MIIVSISRYKIVSNIRLFLNVFSVKMGIIYKIINVLKILLIKSLIADDIWISIHVLNVKKIIILKTIFVFL